MEMDFTRIEAIVAEHFGVQRESLKSASKDREVCDARMFLWYILHKSLGYSMTCICATYKRSRRNIFHAIAVIQNGLASQPFYSRNLADILERMKELSLL